MNGSLFSLLSRFFDSGALPDGFRQSAYIQHGANCGSCPDQLADMLTLTPLAEPFRYLLAFESIESQRYGRVARRQDQPRQAARSRSEEHTSELQSLRHL